MASTMSDRPLVSICMSTYNQEKYVRESVLGLLSQDYEPLEIIISDDCSTDNTWDVVNRTVEEYWQTGGKHTQIILNRNEVNLGIARHSSAVWAMSHGLLRVCNGGDDISHPTRVTRIVETWLANGRRPLAIYHGAEKINADGKVIGSLGEFYLTKGTLGAVATYAASLRDSFDPIVMKGAAEDTIYANRVRLLGGKIIYLRENLLKYRIGSGVSTVSKNWRKPNLACFSANIKSAEQGLLDLEKVAGGLSESIYTRFRSEFEMMIKENNHHVCLLSAKDFNERWGAYKQIHYKPWFRPGGIFQVLCLLPARMGDPILNFLARCFARLDKRR